MANNAYQMPLAYSSSTNRDPVTLTCISHTSELGINLTLSFFYICLYYTAVSVPCSSVIACWERADFLALLCDVSLFHMVSRVRCGT